MDTKAWYQSKTIWGGIITVLSLILSGLHVAISEADQASAIDYILQIVAAVGGLVAIAGRGMAKRRIG